MAVPCHLSAGLGYTRREVICELAAQKVLNLRDGIAPESG
jgi:hypothetical protein